MTAEEILRTKNTYAVVGATPDPWKYGYEVLATLANGGYTVFPVNPKYRDIDGITCYPSIKELPRKPDVVISALAPTNTEKVVQAVKDLAIELMWMPPGCWSDEAVKLCQRLSVPFVHDVCPIGTLKMMASKK